jgi:hypothetical protein
MTWAIVYARPDGWWVAADGFVSDIDAINAGDENDWGGVDWEVIRSDSLKGMLCEEAYEDFLEEEE